MTKYIDVQRRFYQLSEVELKDVETYAAYPDLASRNDLSWDDLTAEPRVLILAEGGSGKTREMQRQVQCLREDRKSAFFLPLESLASVSPENILNRDGEFGAWKAGNALGWFFLDSVDELKLTSAKFAHALNWFASALGQSIVRARVVISSRPHDWQALSDLGHFRSELPLPPPLPAQIKEPADKIFREALQRNPVTPPKEETVRKFPGPADFRVVMLAPLNNNQIRLFASASGVEKVDSFLQELEKENVWQFARRPLDLGNLVGIWKAKGGFGTRAQQHEANVAHKLQEDPDRGDAGVLPDNKARRGAEQLALAMFLSRRKNLHSYEASALAVHEADDLDPRIILDSWNPAERKALLGRAIFQPSTYGRLRFHHRSVHEYLAASCLRNLRQQRMSVKALFRLIFAETYGTKVVIPSMTAVAAWLALWDEDVRAEILRRQPELLLQGGDPGSLDLHTRRTLLTSYVSSYGKGRWRGLSVSHEEIRRLSDSELGPQISEIWAQGIDNEEVKDLLISLIEAGMISNCSTIASSLIHDPAASDHSKVGALHALIACSDELELARLASAIQTQPSSWRPGFVRSAMLALFPEFLPATILIQLMEQFGRRRANFSSDGWIFLHHIKSANLSVAIRGELVRTLADIIVRNARKPLRPYSLQSDFSHLSGSLIHVCVDQIKTGEPTLATEAVGLLVVAARFRDETSYDGESFGSACDIVRSSPQLLRTAFEKDYAFITELLPQEEPRRLMLGNLYKSLIGNPVPSDAGWLEEIVDSRAETKLKQIAFEIVLRLWRQEGSDPVRLEALRMKADGDPEQEALLSTYEFPPPPDPAIAEMERDNQRHASAHDRNEAKRLKNWEAWRESINATPDQAFDQPMVRVTIENLHSWLMGRSRSSSYCGLWDQTAIVAVFGEENLGRAREAFRRWWRTNSPLLPRQKGEELKNKTPFAWLYGLTGVEIETTISGWTDSLSDQEIALAATYATVEINGLAPFLLDLGRSHPKIVERTLGTELELEFASFGSDSYLQILQHLTHAHIELQDLMTPCLIRLFLQIDGSAQASTSNHLAHNLDQVFRILRITADQEQRKGIGEKCLSEYLLQPSATNAPAWLKGLMIFAPHEALPILEYDLENGDHALRDEATKRLSELFGDRGERLPIPDNNERAATLGRLIRLAYCVETTGELDVSANDDDESDEVVLRGSIGSARGNLLNALLEISGQTAQNEIRLLATDPKLYHQSDRLIYLAREKAAADSEPTASPPEVIRQLLSKNELPPEDQSALFQVMIDRLDDLAHEVAHHSFSDRATLRKIVDEIEMQRNLALRLEKASNDCYTIARESEMADLKRNDIQLSIMRNNIHVVIEVKLADNNGWSVADFTGFLSDQLQGQYLRHENCTAGCLLLVYRGDKQYWLHPVTKAKMMFDDVIEYLQKCATSEEIQADKSALRVRTIVMGLNLCDPVIHSPQIA